MDERSKLALERPRSIWEMLVATVELYRRVPVLFLAFAAIVVVPYEVIVLVITGKGPFEVGQMAFVPRQLLIVIDSFLVTPLISALHIHAVREVGDGGQPRLVPTFRQSLPNLPTVAIAAGVSSIAITAGSLAFAVPGAILLSIWAVVAQAAALEGGSWIAALRRSAALTRGYRWHAFGLVLVAVLIVGLPWAPLFFAFRHTTTSAASFLAGTALQVLLRSFEALIIAVLYFDLKARPREPNRPFISPELDPNVSVSEAPTGTGDPLTPDGYTDADRPRGWYIDPEKPRWMRYWAAGHKPVWSRRRTRTPHKTLIEWEKLRESREREDA
jgi:hypothetical protein